MATVIPLLTFLGSLSLESIQHPIDTPLTQKGGDKWHRTSWQEWRRRRLPGRKSARLRGSRSKSRHSGDDDPRYISSWLLTLSERTVSAVLELDPSKPHCEIVFEKGDPPEEEEVWRHEDYTAEEEEVRVSLFARAAVTIGGRVPDWESACLSIWRFSRLRYCRITVGNPAKFPVIFEY